MSIVPGNGMGDWITRFDDKSSFLAFQNHVAPRRILAEKFLSCPRKSAAWRVPGFCQVDRKLTLFQVRWLYSDGRTPNFREWMVCPHCRLNNRQRFAVYLATRFLDELPASTPKRVYAYEAVTPLYECLKKRFAPQVEVIGSEYLGPEHASGTIISGIRHEDAMAMSFPDDHFDLIVSNDVLEHVPDFDRAVKESARVLKPGGKMLFSIPFHQGLDRSARRARLTSTGIEHLLPPQFHGNPISADGSLVFHDFGWDVLDHCRKAGFSDAFVLAYYSFRYGYLGNGLQNIFVAEKSK